MQEAFSHFLDKDAKLAKDPATSCEKHKVQPRFAATHATRTFANLARRKVHGVTIRAMRLSTNPRIRQRTPSARTENNAAAASIATNFHSRERTIYSAIRSVATKTVFSLHAKRGLCYLPRIQSEWQGTANSKNFDACSSTRFRRQGGQL
jgi:hypothetical protein